MNSNWHYHESGTGETLVLLHGIGMSHAAWMPVIPYLAKHRRVIAFDLAGFGQSPALPDGLEPTMENLANVLRENLQRLGIQTPVHLAGNSLGGHRQSAESRSRLWRFHLAVCGKRSTRHEGCITS